MIVDFKLKSPLIHSGFDGRGTDGNHTGLRRFPVWHGGIVLEIPALSGNSLRGKLRRIIMRDLLKRMWANRMLPPPEHDMIYAILANGGLLTGHDATVNTDRIREIREACPALSAFGSAMQKWMLEGTAKIGICWPVLLETGQLTGRVSKQSLATVEADIGHVRLPDKGRRDMKDQKPMPHTFETILAGTTLTSEIIFASTATDLERSCIAWGLDRVRALGAKGAVGMGRCKTTHDGDSRPWQEWLDNGKNIAACEQMCMSIA